MEGLFVPLLTRCTDDRGLPEDLGKFANSEPTLVDVSLDQGEFESLPFGAIGQFANYHDGHDAAGNTHTELFNIFVAAVDDVPV